MKPHQPSYYRDGYLKIEFCKKCGAEGEELLLPCPIKKNKNDEVTVDNKSEPS